MHYSAPPVTGGVEAVMAAQAKLLRGAGHDVRVIAGRGAAEIVPEADSRHPAIEALTRRLAAGDPAGGDFEAARSRLATALRERLEDRDVVVVHNVLTMPFNLPLAAALVDTGRPLVAWTHDLAWADPRQREFQRPGRPWSILRRPQAGVTYVAVSRTRRAQLCEVMDLPPRRVAVVPDGVEPAALWGLRPATLRLAARGGFAGAEPLVLVPVRVTPRKRLELALEAAARLRRRHPGLRLVVSGPLGPHSAANLDYWRELRSLRAGLGLEDVVCFIHELAGPGRGHPADERMIGDLYRMADAILLPSESEGFGLPVLEAALARVPMVAADLPVLMEPGTRYHAFPAGAGPAAVAAALERALAGRAARARRGVLRRYSWPALLEPTERVLEAAIAR